MPSIGASPTGSSIPESWSRKHVSRKATLEMGRQATTRNVLKITISMLISVGLLALVVSRIDFAKLLVAIKSVVLPWLAPYLMLRVGLMVVKVFRWRLVLGASIESKPQHLARALFIGDFGNRVLPAKLGGLFRVQVCRNHNSASFVQVVGTIALERTIDGLVVLSFFALATTIIPFPPWANRLAIVGATVGGVVLLSLIIIVKRYVGPNAPGAPRGNRIVHRSGRLIRRFSIGLRAARSPNILAKATGLTMFAWGMEVVAVTLALKAFNIPLGISAALVLVAFNAVGGAIPSAPSALGTHQFVTMTILGWFGIAPEVAVGLSITTVFLMVVAISTIGLYFLWKEGISLRLFLARPHNREPKT